MATSMHRLQISLPRPQMQYLSQRARREDASVAELIRRMVKREADAAPRRNIESLWEIVGMGQERQPLIEGSPVSERPAGSGEPQSAARAPSVVDAPRAD